MAAKAPCNESKKCPQCAPCLLAKMGNTEVSNYIACYLLYIATTKMLKNTCTLFLGIFMERGNFLCLFAFHLILLLCIRYLLGKLRIFNLGSVDRLLKKAVD